MLSVLKTIFDSNEREVAKIRKLVEKINAFEPALSKLETEALKAKTEEFKERLGKGQTLDDIHFEAFAVVREMSKRVMKMRHFDVQMIGGTVIHQGRIAEMRTGEGKTLVGTSPVYLNALEGKGVHVVTVNDYLAKRDGLWMAPLYHALGMSLGIINHDVAYLYDPEGEGNVREVHRAQAYAADITYGTNNEYGFDYLRDNMVWNIEDKVQRGHNFAIVDEVDSILIDEARTPLIISGRGNKGTEDYDKFAKIAAKLQRDTDYTVEEKAKSAPLTEEGVARVEQQLGLGNLYDMENSESAHYISNALRAKECYRLDIEYVIKDGEIVIVDEFTGRLMFGRRYSDGLHQAIEAKEGVKVRSEDQTLASITFQNYFKLYKKLAGMTGTAATEEREFREIYNVDVVVVPTNKPIARKDLADLVYKDERCKFNACIEDIAVLHEKGRPVLVGTRSIEKSEQLSHMLKQKGIPHNVLNAKYHEKEAEIISQAGRPGAVTIATNMAGRGVDIVLGGQPYDEELAAQVKANGGLHILGTERHESRRIDNQLRGRSGRQGDPGSSRFYVGLDDELMRLFGGDRIVKAMEMLKVEEDIPIESGLVSRGIENAQKKVEGHHFDIRKNVLRYDDAMNEQRKIIYEQRDRIVKGEDLRPQVLHFVEQLSAELVETHCSAEVPRDDWETKELWEQVHDIFNLEGSEASLEKLLEFPRGEMVGQLTSWAQAFYIQKEEELGADTTRAFEKWCLLQTLDRLWIDHLQSIDMLREGIGLRGYGQKDPQIEFIKEAFEMFEALKHRIMEDTVRLLFRLEVRKNQEVKEEPALQVTGTNRDEEEVAQATFRRGRKKVGRNDPCWCGSGQKWKKCHYPEEG